MQKIANIFNAANAAASVALSLGLLCACPALALGTDGDEISMPGTGDEIAIPAIKGDLNNNGEVNIVDAQLAYDIATGKYNSHRHIATLRAIADVNGDGCADAGDALAIQHFAVHGFFADPATE